VRIRGALHIHSILSHDGTMTIAELASWYRNKGYQFIAIGEHSQDLDEAAVEVLKKQSAENSDGKFLIIPGIEFTCRGGIHIFGMGVTHLIKELDPTVVPAGIREHDGFAILAHPGKSHWECSPELLRAVDAAEIWNVGYDGKYLPPFTAMGAFRKMRQANSKLMAVAGHDFHRKPGFYDVAIEMNVDALGRETILDCMREGAYRIQSRYFHADPNSQFSGAQSAWLYLISRPLVVVRKARNAFLRWST
jgi:hypothetical protein